MSRCHRPPLHDGVRVAGMPSEEDPRRLCGGIGDEAERTFLTLVRNHHRGRSGCPTRRDGSPVNDQLGFHFSNRWAGAGHRTTCGERRRTRLFAMSLDLLQLALSLQPIVPVVARFAAALFVELVRSLAHGFLRRRMFLRTRILLRVTHSAIVRHRRTPLPSLREQNVNPLATSLLIVTVNRRHLGRMNIAKSYCNSRSVRIQLKRVYRRQLPFPVSHALTDRNTLQTATSLEHRRAWEERPLLQARSHVPRRRYLRK